MTRCAVLATRNREFYADRVFDPWAVQRMRASLRPMALPWLHVQRAAREQGLRLHTPDCAAQADIDPRRMLLVAYDWTPDAQQLVEHGASPAVLVSFEPPVIAWWLYAHLPQVSARFRDVFLFGGARPRVAPGARFHQLFFPLPPPQLANGTPWDKRRFLVMVNSNKALPRVTDPARWLDRPREVSLKRALAALRYPPIAADQYVERWRAIDALADRPEFDLYGEGFSERRHPCVSPRLHARALRAYRGTPDNKLELLSRYRFALAIENTRFPGYISEKLFDCFFAGTIPVYDGAPDISRYIPADIFIDRAQFSSYAELERFLRELPEQEAQRYLEAGQAFLRSPEFERFSADTFARELVATLNTHA